MSRELKDLELIAKIETDSKDVLFEHIKENEKDFNEVDTKVFELYNKVENIQLIPGEKGEKGDKGDTGEKGDKPVLGVDFFLPKDGKDGYTPIKGIDYFDGENGKDGKDGERGEKGDKPKHRWKGTQLQFEKPDGTWGKLIDLKGEKGSQGFMGESLGASYPSVHFNNNLITTGVRDINFSGSGVDVQVSGTKVNVSVTGGDLSGYVPYTGATGNVDLGSNSLILGDYTFNNATGISTATGGLIINGASGFTAQVGGSNIITANGTATELSFSGNSFLRRDSAGIKLTTLTSDGFVKTSGGTGLLSIDTSTYLTSSTATLQVVTTAGATSNQAITLTSALPQLTLGTQNSIAGGIKFWDNDSLNSFTIQPAKLTTASYTVQYPDHAAGTVSHVFGSGAANRIATWSNGTDLTSSANLTYSAGILQVGGAGTDGILRLYSEQGATDRTWSVEPNTAMTASFSTFGPASLPASVTQVMTMTTGGVMGYLTGTAYTLPVFTGTDTLGELTSVGTTGQILKGNTSAIPSWSDDLILTGKTTTYNNIATEGYGQPAIVDYVALTGQTAAISSTDFTNTNAAGLYRINYYLETTTSDATAGTVQLTISFNDDAGATTIVSSNLSLASTATRIQSSLTNAKQLAQVNSGSISYAVSNSGSFGSAVYALYVSVERLN